MLFGAKIKAFQVEFKSVFCSIYLYSMCFAMGSNSEEATKKSIVGLIL